MYEIVLTQKAQRFYEKADAALAARLNRCFELPEENPHEHPNIKCLRGSLSGYFRYRIGDWRVVYQIREGEKVVIILMIAHRGRVYR